MTYKDLVQKFITKVNVIFNSNPKRREPGDGSDGYCDCIGLIIGAIRRMGIRWSGIHGSNYAARYELTGLKKINSTSELEVGDVVLKAIEKGVKNWALPSRYHPGGKYYNGDVRDYYHAGVVVSVSPFQIKHMSSKMTIDTILNKNKSCPWNYKGRLKKLVSLATDATTPEPVQEDSFKKAMVVANSGSTVNLRVGPSKKDRVMVRVPIGASVVITKPGEEWAAVTYNQFTGYMMAEFLDIIGDGKGKF